MHILWIRILIYICKNNWLLITTINFMHNLSKILSSLVIRIQDQCLICVGVNLFFIFSYKLFVYIATWNSTLVPLHLWENTILKYWTKQLSWNSYSLERRTQHFAVRSTTLYSWRMRGSHISETGFWVSGVTVWFLHSKTCYFSSF